MDKYDFIAMVHSECGCAGDSVFVRPNTPNSCTLLVLDNPSLRDVITKLGGEGYIIRQIDDFFPVRLSVSL